MHLHYLTLDVSFLVILLPVKSAIVCAAQHTLEEDDIVDIWRLIDHCKHLFTLLATIRPG